MQTSTTTRNVYTGNGATTVFAYDYKVQASSELVVTLNGALQTLATHYTVSGVGVLTGGAITMLTAPLSAVEVVIHRSTILTQATEYNRSSLDPQVLETSLDKLTAMVQDARAMAQRALRLEDPELATVPFDPETRVDTIVSFDASGDLELKAKSDFSDEIAADTQPLVDAAAASASAAATSESNAATSASNAATSETNAGISATGAAASALSASDDVATIGTSLADAETEATNAASSASAAAASATAANISKVNALVSELRAEDDKTAAALSASNAATSETNAGTSETNAGLSETAAGLSETAAGTSETNAGLSETAAGLSETASAASAAAALASESAAASSAADAAADALTALNALLNQYQGLVAGGSVPATATTAGDYYRISAVGTSQSVTWAIGDIAIYNGTSGSWGKIPMDTYGFAVEAESDSKFAARAPRPGVISAGTGAAATTPVGVIDLGTSDFSWLGWVAMDNWIVGSTRYLWSMDSGTTGPHFGISTDGKIRLYTRTDTTLWSSTAIPSLTAGRWALIGVTADRNGSLKFYVNGVQLGASVDMSARAETSFSATRETQIFGNYGSVFTTGKIGESLFANRVLTDTEIATIHANGTAVGVIDEADMYQHLLPSESLAAGIFRDVSGNSNHAVLEATGITLTHTYNLPSAPVAQALRNDGSDGAILYTTLGDQGGTIEGDFSVFSVGYPNADISGSESHTLWAMTTNTTVVTKISTFWVYLKASSGINIQMVDAALSTNDITMSSLSLHAICLDLAARGIPPALLISREDGVVSVKLSIAGLDPVDVTNLFVDRTATGTATWSDDVLADYLVSGYRISTQSTDYSLSALELLNTAPTLAEFEYRVRNGRWEPKFAKGGDTTYANDFSSSAGTFQSITTSLGTPALSAGELRTAGTASAGTIAIYKESVLTVGKSYRITATFHVSAALVGSLDYVGLRTSSNSMILGSALSGVTPVTVSFYYTPLSSYTGGGARLTFAFGPSASTISTAAPGTGNYIYVDDLTVTELGVTTALDLSDGGGFQPKNPRAENGSSHWSMSTTGIEFTQPNRIGKTILADLAAQTAVQQLTGASVIPVGWEIVRARAKVDSGTSTLTIGSASGLPADYAASVSIGTTWTTIPLTTGITTTANIYAQLGTSIAGDVEFEIQPRGTN
jgi:hypothetical protein